MKKKTIKFSVTVDSVVNRGAYCPIPIEVFPNQMGINLCAVKDIEWEEWSGQLVSLTVNFIPETNWYTDKELKYGYR